VSVHQNGTASRDLEDRISAVMKMAEGKGYIKTGPTPTAVKLLPPIVHRPDHYNALSFSQLTTAITTVKASNAYRIAINALIFLTLTAARSGEVRKATWNQIDHREKEWTMPSQNT
jgi:integrase